MDFEDQRRNLPCLQVKDSTHTKSTAKSQIQTLRAELQSQMWLLTNERHRKRATPDSGGRGNPTQARRVRTCTNPSGRTAITAV